MRQLARIFRNLIAAERYEEEHKEWLENLFHPIDHLEPGYDKPLHTGREPMTAPKRAYKRDKSFVRDTYDRCE